MIVVAACFRIETAWIPKIPGTRVVRVRIGAPSGFARAITAGGRPDLLISTGFCGGLDPRLGTGDLILATEVIHHGRAIAIAPELLTRARAALAREGIHPAPGRLVTAARVIGKKAEKERLHNETEALGVEMEAGRLAEWADDNGLPFLAVKSVLDPAGVELPLSKPGDVLRHPIAAISAGFAAIRAGRAIGRGIGTLAREFAGGEG
ncbi:hypothetical protein DRJ12_03555 [Candidatus Acetothermia bacterium]|nr:MAG: hypothetical protein DRJ12_03555 [Candidatus Acetothermia bacterium]